MKSKVRLVYVFVVVAMALSIVIGASASDNRIEVLGIERPLCPGHEACTVGEWTFPGGNMHVRNWVLVYDVVGINDDRITGMNTLVANSNWDANGFGPGWGTFHNQLEFYDGYWEGTWAAQMTADGYVSRIVGKGYGELDGLMFHATEVNGYLEGVILELPGK